MGTKLSLPTASSTFDRIKRIQPSGAGCWSSRDFARVLGHTDHRNFETVIEKVRAACLNSGQRVEDHFVDLNEMIGIGKGGQRTVTTVILSRHACHLVIQNADPSKPFVALGQTYFAVQTRRQELADDRASKEDRMRLLPRDGIKKHKTVEGRGRMRPKGPSCHDRGTSHRTSRAVSVLGCSSPYGGGWADACLARALRA